MATTLNTIFSTLFIITIILGLEAQTLIDETNITPVSELFERNYTTHFSDDVTHNPDSWDINVSSQQNYHILVSMNNHWGFHQTQPSSIQLQIESNMDISNIGDLEIILIFSVSKSKYFSFIINMDNRQATPNWIYPACNTSLANGDILQLLSNSSSRRETIANGSKLNWCNLQWSQQFINTWPIWVEISNYPSKNLLIFTYKNPEGGILTGRYNEAFPTDQGIDIAISGDQNGEQFSIQEIMIKSYILPSDAPSTSPTKFPSQSPTELTINPSTAPSLPSISPTYSPSSAPFIQPKADTVNDGIGDGTTTFFNAHTDEIYAGIAFLLVVCLCILWLFCACKKRREQKQAKKTITDCDANTRQRINQSMGNMSVTMTAVPSVASTPKILTPSLAEEQFMEHHRKKHRPNGYTPDPNNKIHHNRVKTQDLLIPKIVSTSASPIHVIKESESMDMNLIDIRSKMGMYPSHTQESIEQDQSGDLSPDERTQLQSVPTNETNDESNGTHMILPDFETPTNDMILNGEENSLGIGHINETPRATLTQTECMTHLDNDITSDAEMAVTLTSPNGGRTLKLFKIDSNISNTTETMTGEYNYHGLDSPNTIVIQHNNGGHMKDIFDKMSKKGRKKKDPMHVPPIPLPHQGSISASASRTVTFVKNCRTNAAMNDSV